MASSNRHLVLATNSFKLALASPANSSAPNSLTHSVNSFSVLRSQWQLAGAFELGGTKGGRGGVALGSVEAAPWLRLGEWVEEERVKKEERSDT